MRFLGFLRRYWIALAVVLIVLIVFVSGLVRYDSRLELVSSTGQIEREETPDVWLQIARLEAPVSVWRYFFRVQDATYETNLHASTESWLTDRSVFDMAAYLWPPENPEYNKQYEALTRTKFPVRGSTPPVAIVFEMHRTRPYDADREPKPWVFTVTYTILGIERQKVLYIRK